MKKDENQKNTMWTRRGLCTGKMDIKDREETSGNFNCILQKGRIVLLFMCCLVLLVGCNRKQENKREVQLDRVNHIETSLYETSYENITHRFLLELPGETAQASLIVMLPGYGESITDFQKESAIEEVAKEKGYAVVYVEGAPEPKDATSAAGWNSGIGESEKDDVAFLCALSRYLCTAYELNPDRVYAVGFSNGAFMTHRLAVEAADTFSAVVSVAGMMPEKIWKDRPAVCNISVFQITGEKDDVVPKNSDGSAKYAKAPAIEEVMEYYVNAEDLMLMETVTIGKKSILTKYDSEKSKRQVWNLFIPDGRHSWPDERYVGFQINQLILDFLDTQE